MATILCVGAVLIRFQMMAQPIDLPSARELENAELFIQNAAYEIGEYQAVNDPSFQRDVSRFCADLTPFRPYVLEFDMTLGVSNFTPRMYFVCGSVRYTFSMSDAHDQMQYDFIHRDKPILYVSKTITNEVGQAQEAWCWLCEMDAADYAGLYNTVSRYTEGTITQKLP